VAGELARTIGITSVAARCPGMRSTEHGSWYFSADLPSAGERRRVRRGGFATRAAAVAALAALTSPPAGPEPDLSTGEWLESRLSLRASTARSYTAHVRGYLVPYLGGIPLGRCTRANTEQTWEQNGHKKSDLE
jgi:hypothetical protein